MMYNRIYFFLFLFLFYGVEAGYAQELYSEYFEEVKTICDKDAGKLWGVNLYAPIVCIDSLRNVWSNEKDNEGKFSEAKGLYRGHYPLDENVANSITHVYGKKWVMVMLPLPENRVKRNTLLLHEMFHYWQDSLQLIPQTNYNNAHIDQCDARIWLKMEWTALHKACLSVDENQRKRHITDALCFRAYRRHLYAAYKNEENAFEVHEGLPQYTGLKMSCSTDADYIGEMQESFETYMDRKDLVRSFAYHSGVAYGYLLDKSRKEWRLGLAADTDLGQLLQNKYAITLPADFLSFCNHAKEKYPYNEIKKSEEEWRRVREQELENLRKVFTSNCLTIPLYEMKISFNPTRVLVIEGLGTLYREARIIDKWGILEVENVGCVISNDWKHVIVPDADLLFREGNLCTSKGWKITVAEGFDWDRMTGK